MAAINLHILDDVDTVILATLVNGVTKGDIVAALPRDGNGDQLWISTSDFAKLGVALSDLPQRSLEGTEFVLLASSTEISVRVNLSTLVAVLEVSPSLLGNQVIGFSSVQPFSLSPSSMAQGYLNYALAFGQFTGESPALNMNATANLGWHDWIIRSQHHFTYQAGQASNLRLGTFVQRDWPSVMGRVRIGDIEPSHIVFGRAGALTGISYSRQFDTRPGFVSKPTFSYAGMSDMPAVADIYVDGAKLHSVDLQPGLFEFRDLAYFAGLRHVEIVIVDAVGNRQIINVPFYFSDNQLARGVQEFGYAFGQPRYVSGSSEQHGPAGFAGWHRLGITNFITAGLSAESFPNYRSLGLDTALRLGSWGVLSANVAQSNAAGQVSARAALIGYSFSGGPWSFSTNLFRQDENFGRFPALNSSPPAIGVPRRQLATNLSFSIGPRQTLSFGALRGSTYGAANDSLFSVRHSLSLFEGATLGTSIARRDGATGATGAGWEAAISLSINFENGLNLNSITEQHGGPVTQTLSVDRQIPTHGSWGGQATYTHDSDNQSLDSFAQHKGTFGDVSMSVRYRTGTEIPISRGGQISLNGALSFLDHDTFLSRSIGDSFAVVQADGMPDARIYQNNQFIGRTRHDGRLLVPSIGAYTRNQLRLDDRDVPLEIELGNVTQTIIPRAFLGTIARFAAKRVSAAAGRLLFNDVDGTHPVVAALLTAISANQTITSSTGPDGDFYLDNLVPGVYTVTAENFKLTCTAQITLSQGSTAFTDFGEIDCVSNAR